MNRHRWFATTLTLAVLAAISTPKASAQRLILRKSGSETPMQRHIRSGYLQRVAPWAQPSAGRNYAGYYVGGGVPIRGEGRYRDEGTWGWDYAPWYSAVRLLWSHGRRYQDGGGQYEPDRKNNPLRGFFRR